MKPDAGLSEALAHHRAGRLADAEAAYRACIARSPEDGNAWNLLGVLLHQTARPLEACAALARATDLLPDFADAHSNRAMVCLDAGDLETAAAAVDRALALSPGHGSARALSVRVWRARGARAFATGDFVGALAAFLAARQAGAAGADTLLDLANTLRRLGRQEEAVGAYREALAVASCQASPALRARCEVAMATALRESGYWSEPLRLFRQACADDPSFADAWQGAGILLLETGRATEALALLRRAVELAPDHAGFGSNLLGALQYADAEPAHAVLASHRAWAERHAAARAESVAVSTASSPLRVGLLSADLRAHPVACFLESWLPHMDRQGFAFHAYSDFPVEDAASDRLKSCVSGWCNVSALDDRALASRLAADRLDLLIELSGHTAPNRLVALAARPAPRIWTWIGYPDTTGMPQVERRLVDAVTDPPGIGEASMVERPLRLPGCFLCYAPPPEGRAQRVGAPVPGQRAFSFGSFNNAAKISEEVVAAWSAILHATPGTRLFLKSHVFSDAGVAGDLAGRFLAHGVARERLRIEGYTASRSAHFAAYEGIDLALDPFPYNGTTTTCDALWMGVPVLVLAGRRHAGRVGASLLRAALGTAADDWIAADVEDYIRRAIAAAAFGVRGEDARQSWRDRVAASSLMDGRRFARQFSLVLEENAGRPDPLARGA